MSHTQLDLLEQKACVPVPVSRNGFNSRAIIPHGCTTDHIYQAMMEYISFLQFVNEQLHTKGLVRLESLLMPANFSSVVSEFMNISIPKYCSGLVKNMYHNGHPDLLPAGYFSEDAAQYAHEGIEIKASRYLKGWQGHNAEESWLMVFVFDSNRPSDPKKGVKPRPFRFIKVVGAALTQNDWKFSGRSAESRRTITASVTESGYAKMEANWIYKAADMNEQQPDIPDDDEEGDSTLC